MDEQRLHITEHTQLTIRRPDVWEPSTRISLEDCGPSEGRVSIEYDGASWCAYWSAMGPNSVREFFSGCSVDYLLDRLEPDRFETDWERITRETGVDIDVATALANESHLIDTYGQDWAHDLPRRETRRARNCRKALEVAQQALKVAA